MSGILGKFKALMGLDEEYYEDEYVEEEPSYSSRRAKRTSIAEDTASLNRDRIWDEHKKESRQEEKYTNIVRMPGSARIKELTARYDIMVIDPKSFDECAKLVDTLKSKKPVIVNLERVETETARKIFDFLSGATYALDGDLQKIANNIFVFLPENIGISTNTEHTGMTFGSSDGNPWKL
jgi:cell division inhibitor SepF